MYDINVFYCCSYIVYTIKDKKRIKLGEYPLGNMNLGLCTGGIYPDLNVRLQYIHSFALSQTYVILPLTSYLLEPCQAMGMYHVCLCCLYKYPNQEVEDSEGIPNGNQIKRHFPHGSSSFCVRNG